jgi:hypothetical protein
MLRRFGAVVVVILACLAGLSGPVRAAGEPRFGAALVNVPLIVEHWDRPAVGLRNLGDVPVTAVVTITGAGWGPPETTTPTIAPGERFDVVLTGIGTDRADVRATVQNAEPGMDRAVIVLESVARHQTPWEAIPAYAWLLACLVALGAVWAVQRARGRRWT